MSISSVTGAAFAAASPKANPDKARRVAQALSYFKEVWYFTACFIALLAIGQWIGVACIWYRERRAGANLVYGRQRKISPVRLPRAVVDSVRALAFRWTIPLGTRYQVNVMDVIASAVYATVIFVGSLMNSTSFTGLKFDPRYWANTAGNIAASQLPLVAALGMKNNIISFITGISFDKLNYLHRMTARSVCALIWLHAGGRLRTSSLHAENSLETAHIRCALMAAIAFSILAISFVRPIRERNYEIFLISHFLLVLIALLGIYFHARNFDPDLGRLAWPVFIIWGLDRVLRLLRIVFYNYGYFIPKRAEPFKGTIDVVSPNLIRLKLHRPSFLHWKAGQCVYLTLPQVSKFPLEAHPFTISTIDTPRAVGQNEKDGNNSKLDKELIFLLRVRDGITGRLANAGNSPVTVWMDGPYGSPPSLRGADTALLIAGGSGISFTLPLLLDLLGRARIKATYCRRVVSVWAVREVDDTNWIADVLAPELQSIPTSLDVEVQIYVTNAIAELDEVDSDNDVKDNEKVSTVGVNQALLRIPGVTVQYLRPDISNIVLNAVHDASDSLSVNVCGAPGLTAVTQRVLRTPRFMAVMHGEATVSLHVEAFGN